MFLDEVIEHAIDKPDRVSVIDYLDYISARDGFKYLDLFHTEAYVDKLKSSCKSLKNDDFAVVDGETHVNRYSFDMASLAVGASVQAAESAKVGKNAFAIVRPPGHHAHSDYSHGFCLFNNIAIATEHLRNMNYGNERILIVDLDLHHGDGTEEYALGRKNVFYFSMHQEGLFPETGYDNDVNVVNVPVEAGISQKYYEALMQRNIDSILQEFRPTLVGISAGFDMLQTEEAVVGNGLNLSPSVYSKLLDLIEPIPFYAILEGGYNHESVRQGVQEFINWEKR